MKLRVQRITKRTREALKDIDYTGKLNEADREWLEVFLDGYYGADLLATTALTGSPKAARKMQSEANRANYIYRHDISSRFTRLSILDETDVEDGDMETAGGIPKIASEDFQFYRCTRCLKSAEGCRCPERKYNKPYGMEDYTPLEASPESAYAEAEQALREKAYDLLPYGENPVDLKPGHKVIICLPHHFLKDRSGTVMAYRQWTDEYLIEADRPGLKDRDGTQTPRTLCWVKPQGLKRATLAIARERK